MVQTFPDRFVATVSKSRRRGKILIDYLRNAQGATAVCAYSPRARAHAPVATPIDWEDLGEDVRFHHFNVRNIPSRLNALRRDPWQSFPSVKQSVTKAILARFGVAA